jgi:hypothetical protein
MVNKLKMRKKDKRKWEIILDGDNRACLWIWRILIGV